MGKSLFNKLGNILRVFKGGKKKDIDKSNDGTIVISSSESEMKGSEISSQRVEFFNNLQPRISKSIDNLSIATDPLSNEFNKLKRTKGTYDILEATKEEEVKLIQSLDRFSHLKNTNSLVLSYNAKLYNSTIWSQALGRALQKEMCKTSVSTVQTETASFRKDTDSGDSYDTLKIISDKRKGLGDLMLHKGTDNDSTEIIYTQSEKSASSSEATHKSTSTYEENNKISEETLELPEIFTDFVEPHVFSMTQTEKEVAPEESISMRKISEIITTTSYSSEIIVNKKNVEIEVDVESLRNLEQVEHDTIINSKSDSTFGKINTDDGNISSNVNDCSKIIPSSTTEYEVVNLTQVDLFKEFKTTIAKMRNVLNVLEDKKSLKRITEQRTNDQKMNERITAHLERKNNGHISTQTAIMTFNQTSTSTDAGLSNQPKNEGVMVQFSSDTPSKCQANSKSITLDSALFNYVKPLEKIRRRKRCKKMRRNRYDRKKPADIPLPPTKTSKRVEKSQYNKCIVYHITQHKNAVDRCVGTPLFSSKKDSLVLHNTFSALHFGPISEFPALLNKHENEINRRKELKYKVDSKHFKNDSNVQATPKRPCAVPLPYQPNNENSFKREAAFSTTTTTTANWMVFEPPAPLMLQNTQSTSDEIILDRNKSSTQEMISKLLDEEFKTSGLKGKVSSNTMNLIKDQFCDKFSHAKTKDIPDIMVTVCVPLKEIVSKIKTSKKPSHEDKAVEYDLNNDSMVVKNQPSCDMGVQVTLSKKDINDTLQTIPEKISKRPYEIYQQNKLLRKSTSYNKLSSFKKIFLSKNSSSNIDPSGQNYPKSSRIFFSDHSTSSPQFLNKRSIEKNIAISKRSSSDEARRFRNESNMNIKKLKEGFFLNLPPNRFKKKRAQISKLFDGSDSSDRKYSEEPKLLYHVHDSSFYSSSKTDERFATQKPSKKILHQENTSCYPLHHNSSTMDIKAKPKFISFSDFLVRDEVEEERNKNIGQTQVKRKKLRKFKNADMNTSVEKICKDCCTQYDNSLIPSKPLESDRMEIQRVVAEEESSPMDCMEEYSVFQKVRFQDDIRTVATVTTKDPKINEGEKITKNGSEEKTESTSNCNGSTLSLFEETAVRKKSKSIHVDVGIQKSFHEIPVKDSVKQIHTEEPKILPTQPQGSIANADSSEPAKTLEETKEDVSKEIVIAENENNINTENNFKDLIRNIVNVCNTSFIKSRDCIVELTIYNLIKEIILDHCSHLTEQSKKKVETILANFVQDCKCKAVNQDIKIVESALENLVKEIDSNSNLKPKESDLDRKASNDEYKHKSRSKSRHHGHKHKSKHHSHHRETEEQRYHESRHRSKKRHHKHTCDNDDKCDLWKEETEKEFRTVDGRKEYLELIKRLKELENVTKQLSSVARDQQVQQVHSYMKGRSNQQVYTVLTEDAPLSMSKRKMRFSLSHFHEEKDLNFIPLSKSELSPPVVPIPRNVPKLPVTKIVINLANLKLLTENCASMSSSLDHPVVFTDSTEEKHKLMNQLISFERENNMKKHLSYHTTRESDEQLSSLKSDVVHKKKELFTITIHGNKNTKSDETKDKKDFMRIKMCRKNKTITSSSQQTTTDSYTTKIYKGKTLGMRDIHRITKEYIKRELNLKNDVLCSDIARDLLENKCHVDQVLGKKDTEMAHQRMANFCLFRNLLKKSS